MEKVAFTNLEDPWWLLKDDKAELVDDRIVEARKTLAENLKLGSEWFKNQTDVDQLFEELRSKNEKLITDLDSLTTVDENVTWLQEIVKLTSAPPEQASQPSQSAAQPSQSAAQPATAPPATAPPATAPSTTAPPTDPPTAWDPVRNMLYRQKADASYEFAFSNDQLTIRPGSTWMSEKEANDALNASREAPAPAPPPPPGEADGTWDDNWKMIYRTGPGGEYQLAFSDDQRTIRSGTTWMTRDEATAARAQAAAPGQPGEIKVENVLADAITQLTPDFTTSVAEELSLDAADVAGLTENERFKEIMKEVIESRLATAAAA